LPPRSDTSLSVICKRYGISRATLYVWRNRLLSGGLIRLADLPPVRKRLPPRKVEKLKERVLEISHANPAWGCKLISRAMAEEGTPLSVASVQKILNAAGRRTRKDRCGQSGPLAPRRSTSVRSDNRSS
jgi:transposase